MIKVVRFVGKHPVRVTGAWYLVCAAVVAAVRPDMALADMLIAAALCTYPLGLAVPTCLVFRALESA